MLLTYFSDKFSDDAIPDVVLVLLSIPLVPDGLYLVRKTDVFGYHLGEVGTVALVDVIAAQRRVVAAGHQVRRCLKV